MYFDFNILGYSKTYACNVLHFLIISLWPVESKSFFLILEILVSLNFYDEYVLPHVQLIFLLLVNEGNFNLYF